MSEKFSHSFDAASEIEVELDEIDSRLVELVGQASQPLFTRFFFQVEAEDVQQILALACQS